MSLFRLSLTRNKYNRLVLLKMSNEILNSIIKNIYYYSMTDKQHIIKNPIHK